MWRYIWLQLKIHIIWRDTVNINFKYLNNSRWRTLWFFICFNIEEEKLSFWQIFVIAITSPGHVSQ
jgi:hypothetical protein